MKKTFLTIILATSTLLHAQNNANSNSKPEVLAWKEKDIVASVGYGFPNLVKVILKSSVERANVSQNNTVNDKFNLAVKGFGPALFKYEYALSKLIGIGLTSGYWSTSLIGTHDYTDTYYNQNTGSYSYANYQDVLTYKITSLAVGARLNFHFATSDKLDPYAGLAAGYSHTKFALTEKSTNPNYKKSTSFTYTGVPVYFSITVGMRYYFTDNIGIYGELGIDKTSLLQGGLAIKF